MSGCGAGSRGSTRQELSAALTDRTAVRMGLLRGTLHLVTATDARGAVPAIRDVLVRAFRSSPVREDPRGRGHRGDHERARARRSTASR